MTTYKIEKAVRTIETIEIELPYYSKNICYCYKVISETEAIQVCFARHKKEIATCDPETAFTYDSIQCTEEDFNKKFTETLDLIVQMYGR